MDTRRRGEGSQYHTETVVYIYRYMDTRHRRGEHPTTITRKVDIDIEMWMPGGRGGIILYDSKAGEYRYRLRDTH
jgi:hypothetical protein